MASKKEQVKALRNQNPTMRASEIASELRITRQRVGQILIELKLPTTFKKEHFCTCGKEISSVQKYCKSCFSESRRMDLVCFVCKQIFQRLIKEYVGRNLNQYASSNPTAYPGGKYTGKVFCSRHCFGIYVGKTFGFAAHPENSDLKKSIQ